MTQRLNLLSAKRRLLAERLEDRRMLAGPYAPAAGQLGSTAIAMDDPSIVGWATEVAEYRRGTNVDVEFQTPHRALGPAEGTSGDTVSLGRGGAITLGFNAPIRDGLGFDFAVFENGFSDTFLELAHVEVSSNGIDFVRFPSDSLTTEPVDAFGSVDPTNIDQLAGKYRVGFGTPFDLGRLSGVEPSFDLTRVTHVRLVDVVGDGSALDASGDAIYDPFPTEGSAGFDLDAVAVIREDGSVRELVGFEDLGASLPDASGFIGPVEGGISVVGPYGDDVVIGDFSSGSLAFNNAHSLTYGSWNQFAYSNRIDVITPGYQNELSAFPGIGAGGSETFGVGFMDQSGGFDLPTIRRQVGDTRLLESIKVTNTTYAALSMRDGDDFAKAFGGESGDDPDFFSLTMTGKDAAGDPIGTVEVYLADYRFTENSADYIVDQWLHVDLSPIAKADLIEFEIASSDVGDFGINTPAYFAIDEIVLKERVLPFDLADLKIVESDGNSATTARVSRPDSDAAEAVTVSFVSSMPELVTVPAAVTIAAGEAYADFAISVVDDALFQGTRSVLIEASAEEWTGTSRTIIVEDDEARTIDLALPSSVDEGESANAIVTRNDANLNSPLVVAVASSDPELVSVPATITIPAGHASAEFSFSSVDDALYRVAAEASVSISAASYEGDNATVSIAENDSPALSIVMDAMVLDESGGGHDVRLEDLGSQLATASFYNGADEAGGFISDGLYFNNEYNPAWGSWSGWAYSNTTDTTTPGYTNQYSVFVERGNSSEGTGAFGSDTYAVAAAYSTPRVVRDPEVHGAFQTIEVANTTYAALSMQQGDDFAKKFGGETGDDPDFFLLTIEGFDSLGESTGLVDFYLADYRFNDNQLDYIVDQWTTVDVSSLGDAVELRFALSSSDVGQFGMNTPAYFAADRFSLTNTRTAAQGTLRRNTVDVSRSVDVQLISSDWSELQLPGHVTIPAGESSTRFPLSIIDDALVDGMQTVEIGAAADGFGSAAETITVTDDDIQRLNLTVSAETLVEGEVARAVLHRNVADLSSDLPVSLTVDPSGQLVFPSVVIPVGARSVEFSFSATDNDVVDEDRVVGFAANASGFVGDAVELMVRNEDVPPELSLVVNHNVLSESSSGFQVATATLVRSKDDLSESVEVFLKVEPAGQVTLPDSVVIPASQDQVEFSIEVIDDLLADGDQPIVVEANAERYISSSVEMTVIDDEVPTIELSVLDSVVDESSGGAATQLMLYRNTADVSEPLVVELAAPIDQLVLVDQVTFLAGQDSTTVNVGVLDNLVLEGDRAVQLTANAVGFVSDPVGLSITDDEVAGIRVFADAEPIRVSELLGENQFGVALASMPLSDVTVEVNLETVDVDVSVERLVFTPLSWDQAQSVKIVGVPDLLIDPETVAVHLQVDGENSDALYSAAANRRVDVLVEDEQPAKLQLIEDGESVFLVDVESGVRLQEGSHVDGLQVVANLLSQDLELGHLSATTGVVEFDAAGGDDRVQIRGTNFTRLIGGTGVDQLWLNLDQPVAFVDLLSTRVEGFEEYGIASDGGATVTIDLTRLGEVVSPERVPVLRLSTGQDLVFAGMAVLDDPVFYEGEFAQVIKYGEQRLRVISEQPWQNSLSRWDVNYDESVTSIDALLAINQLARKTDVDLPAIESLSQFDGAFFDVSGDGLLTALDPLIVINELARRVFQAEGESISTLDFETVSRRIPWEGEAAELPPVSKKIIGMPEQIDHVMKLVGWDDGSPDEEAESVEVSDSLCVL